MRARECESSLPLAYLHKLSAAYEDFLEDISQIIPVLRVNWSEFHSAEEMALQIQKQYAKLRSIKRVDWDDAPAAPVPKALAAPTTPQAFSAAAEQEEGGPAAGGSESPA